MLKRCARESSFNIFGSIEMLLNKVMMVFMSDLKAIKMDIGN